ncbi:MAG TPA: ATP-binding protein [Roseiflexaceae bacterium]|nr:ATP-binding protein [Roseiflexaceae bacterium]
MDRRDGEILYAIAVATAGEDNLEHILGVALDHLSRVVRLTGGSIALVEGDELVVRAAIGPFAETARRLRLPRGDSIVWRVVTSGEPYLSHDLAAEGRRPSSDFRSFLAVPLIWRGAAFGLLEVDSIEPHAFTEHDMALLQKVATALSGSIELARRYARNVELYEQAQEAIRIRDMFLSIAAHELKTPLATLLGYTGLLLRRAERSGALSEQDLRLLRVIDAQGGRLNRLVVSLLDLSRIQAGHLSIDLAPLDLQELARRIVEEVQPTLTAHTVTLIGPAAAVWIAGDALRLEQVVYNLLQNAVKYSPHGGEIHVRVGVSGERAHLAVTDQGIGIPPDALPQIFDRFYRAANADRMQIAGMGIGLYVVREIVALHGGSVEVSSVEGQGSTFSVWLPLAPAYAGGSR